MNVKKVIVSCPSCNLEFGKGIWRDGRLKRNPKLFIFSCKRCLCLFVERNITCNREELNSYILSEEYKTLYKKHINSKPFLIVYEIYKYLNKKEKFFDILYSNYLDTEEYEDLKLAYNFIQENNDYDSLTKRDIESRKFILNEYKKFEE